MPEPTLAEIVQRLEAIERRLADQAPAQQPRKKDWRRVVGMFDDDPEFMREVIAEVEAAREAERQAAREGKEE
jgi:hypothetical protein